MAITNVKPIKNTGAYLRYITSDQAHTEDKLRMADFKTINCSLSNANQELRKIAELYNKKDNIRAYSYLFSWSDEELNPNDNEDIEKALKVAESTLTEIAGNDRQMVLVAQNDGTGGKLHIHALVGSIDIQTGKSLRGKSTGHYYLKEVSDRIQKQMNIKNLNSIERNLEVKDSMAEIKMRDRGAYVWKDDLRSRIEEAKENGDFTSLEEFQSYMKNNYNVEVTARNSKKVEAQAFNGKDKQILSYSFKDDTGMVRRARENKLGTSYGALGVYNAIEHNKSLREPNTLSKKLDEIYRDTSVIDQDKMFDDIFKIYQDIDDKPRNNDKKQEIKTKTAYKEQEQKTDLKADIPVPSHKQKKPKKLVKMEKKRVPATEKAELEKEKEILKQEIPIPRHKKRIVKKLVKAEKESKQIKKAEEEPRQIIKPFIDEEEVKKDIIPSLECGKDEEQERELEEWKRTLEECNKIIANLDDNWNDELDDDDYDLDD